MSSVSSLIHVMKRRQTILLCNVFQETINFISLHLHLTIKILSFEIILSNRIPWKLIVEDKVIDSVKASQNEFNYG